MYATSGYRASIDEMAKTQNTGKPGWKTRQVDEES
jgi:hypothetical protein